MPLNNERHSLIFNFSSCLWKLSHTSPVSKGNRAYGKILGGYGNYRSSLAQPFFKITFACQTFLRQHIPDAAYVYFTFVFVIKRKCFIHLQLKRPGAVFGYRHVQDSALFRLHFPGLIKFISRMGSAVICSAQHRFAYDGSGKNTFGPYLSRVSLSCPIQATNLSPSSQQ